MYIGNRFETKRNVGRIIIGCNGLGIRGDYYKIVSLNIFCFWLQVGREVAHPGVANDFNEEDAQKYYTYYQWVCFVLFFQVNF